MKGTASGAGFVCLRTPGQMGIASRMQLCALLSGRVRQRRSARLGAASPTAPNRPAGRRGAQAGPAWSALRVACTAFLRRDASEHSHSATFTGAAGASAEQKALGHGDLGDAPGRNRTCDTRFRKPVLYPLSYEGLPAQLSPRSARGARLLAQHHPARAAAPADRPQAGPQAAGEAPLAHVHADAAQGAGGDRHHAHAMRFRGGGRHSCRGDAGGPGVRRWWRGTAARTPAAAVPRPR